MQKSTAFLLMALVAGPASAAETFQYNVRGDGAEGGASTYSECGGADAWLSMSEQAQRGPDAWQGQWGSVSFSIFNWCTGEQRYGWADLSSSTFVGNGPKGSTLQANVTGFSEQFLGCEWVEHETPVCVEEPESGESWCEDGFWDCRWNTVEIPVVLDLAWQPTDISRGVSTQQYIGKDFISRWRSVGQQGYGALVGTFRVGDVDLLEAGSSWGTSWTATSGSVWVTKTR
jgi:hypothetical protein